MGQSGTFIDIIASIVSENVEQATAHWKKTGELLPKDLNTEIAVTPHDIVYREDRIKLKHYKATQKRHVQTPLLIVYALVNRYTMLDLKPGGF